MNGRTVGRIRETTLAESGHIIVCGMGDIGYRVVELLHRLGERVVVITEKTRDERRQSAEAAGVKIHFGDARNERLLLEANLREAAGLVAATDQDLVNIETALDAHRFRPDLPVVVRIFDQSLASQLETSFGLRRALGMSALAAPNFAAAALGASVLESFQLGGEPYVIGRAAGLAGPLRGAGDVAGLARSHRLLTLARERPDGTCSALPDGGEEIAAGDRLTLLGRKADWDRLFGPPETAPERVPLRRRMARAAGRLRAAWRDEPLPLRALLLGLGFLLPLTVALFHLYLDLSVADAVFYTVTNLFGEIGLATEAAEIKMYEILLMVLGSLIIGTLYSMMTDALVASRLRKLLGDKPMPRSGHVVVVGIGHVGYQVVAELLALGVQVVAVDSQADVDQSFLSAVRTQVPVALGDARLEETLGRAGIARARAVVAATGDDAVNLGIGLAAKRINPRLRTVIRLFDAEMARKVENVLAIDAALGAARIAAPTFAASTLYGDVLKALLVGDRLLVLRQRQAGPEWSGKTPAELREREGVQVLQRDGRFTDGDETPLAPGEEVLAALCRPVAPPWSAAPAATPAG